MTLNQLFKKKPTMELVFKILNLLKYNTIEDFKTRNFSKNDITPYVLEEMEKLKPLFEEYYIKCKFDIYFTFLDGKKIVTILRQCLKLLDYRLDSKKEYISGKRYIVYTIVSTIDPPEKTLDPLKSIKSCKIVFD
jgi:hypothetical protein